MHIHRVGQNRIYTPYMTVCMVMSRDGSYRLLRRPIQYNTLLIRNTRIIRERVYAILGGTLGLHQTTPQPPPNCPPSLQNIIMPPGKDSEWHRVVVMGPKGQIYEMPMSDAGCQNSEISAAVPPASASTS